MAISSFNTINRGASVTMISIGVLNVVSAFVQLSLLSLFPSFLIALNTEVHGFELLSIGLSY